MTREINLFSIIVGTLLMASVSADVAPDVEILSPTNNKGGIFDSACAISVGNINQTIELNQTSQSYFDATHPGKSQQLNIDLVHCLFNQPGHDRTKKFTLIFDTSYPDQRSENINRDSDSRLQLSDLMGNTIAQGMTLMPSHADGNNMRLTYLISFSGNSQPDGSERTGSSLKLRMNYF